MRQNIRIGLFGWLLLGGVSVQATPAPVVVYDDTLALGVRILSIKLDSTHYSEPCLLAGTDTNTSGRSFALRIGGSPLTVLDTILTFGSRVTHVLPGHLDSSGGLDYLIGQDSILTAYQRTAPGEPLAKYPREFNFHTCVRDILIDDSLHYFWVGFQRDTAFRDTQYVGINYWRHFYVDGIQMYSGLADSGYGIAGRRAAWDLQMADFDSDGRRDVIAFWNYKYRVFNDELANPFDPNYHSSGFTRWVAGDSAGVSASMISGGQDNVGGGEEDARSGFRRPVPIVDVDGDGQLEFVFTCFYEGFWESGERTGVFSLDRGQALWYHDQYCPVFVWDVDGDALPDVIESRGSSLWGYRGTTGDWLFVTEVDRPVIPWAVGALGTEWQRRGILVSHDTITTFHLAVSAGIDTEPVVPSMFELGPNYPNPFNGSTNINCSLVEPADITLRVYDVLGRYVRTIAQGIHQSGTHSFVWDGTDMRGREVASGVYFYHLEINESAKSRKMLLLK